MEHNEIENLTNEGNYIMLLLKDIDNVIDNKEYLTEEQLENIINQRKALKFRLLQIELELF